MHHKSPREDVEQVRQAVEKFMKELSTELSGILSPDNTSVLHDLVSPCEDLPVEDSLRFLSDAGLRFPAPFLGTFFRTTDIPARNVSDEFTDWQLFEQTEASIPINVMLCEEESMTTDAHNTTCTRFPPINATITAEPFNTSQSPVVNGKPSRSGRSGKRKKRRGIVEQLKSKHPHDYGKTVPNSILDLELPSDEKFLADISELKTRLLPGDQKNIKVLGHIYSKVASSDTFSQFVGALQFLRLNKGLRLPRHDSRLISWLEMSTKIEEAQFAMCLCHRICLLRTHRYHAQKRRGIEREQREKRISGKGKKRNSKQPAIMTYDALVQEALKTSKEKDEGKIRKSIANGVLFGRSWSELSRFMGIGFLVMIPNIPAYWYVVIPLREMNLIRTGSRECASLHSMFS